MYARRRNAKPRCFHSRCHDASRLQPGRGFHCVYAMQARPAALIRRNSSVVCGDGFGKGGQLPGLEIGFQGGGDGLCGIEAEKAERAVDAQENG